MNINSIIYVDNSNHYIKSTDQDITCVQWCCEWFWLRYHPVAIWLVWWGIWLYDGHRHNLYSSLNIITSDHEEASEVNDL